MKEAIQQYLQSHGYERLALRAFLFDMDGVLYNSMPYHAQSWHRAMKQFGMNLPPEEAYLHEGRTGASTINIVSQRERGRVATDDEIKLIYEAKSAIFNQFPKAQPIEGALEVLHKVMASRLFPMIVTGSGQLSLLERLNQNFPNIFEPARMVTAFDVKFGKPNPEPYLMALQKGGLLPNEAIVVENAPLGVQAAVAAGIFTIAVNTGPLPDEVLWQAGANMVFPSMQAFSDAFDALLSNLS